jgi:transaldolase
MSNLTYLYTDFKVSPWLDNLSRDMIQSGTLKELVEKGVRGVTSNPSIFEAAFSGSSYDEALAKSRSSGLTTEQSYWSLAIEDIQHACDILSPVYASSAREDGYVSLEVSPDLAHDADATILAAEDLWHKVNRQNLMIKIPATEECIPAISVCISKGINVNVTLIFSLHRYLKVVAAYMSGLEMLADPSRVHSVASFFISRVDSAVDERLRSIGRDDLRGQAAVAQARVAHGIFLESFNPLAERWERLAQKGALPQRPLWASTSTKDPAYPDLKYVSGLLAKHSVNTMPDATIAAILDHGVFSHHDTVTSETIEEAHEVIAHIEAAGVSMADVSKELEDQGVEKFKAAFHSMLTALDKK